VKSLPLNNNFPAGRFFLAGKRIGLDVCCYARVSIRRGDFDSELFLKLRFPAAPRSWTVWPVNWGPQTPPRICPGGWLALSSIARSLLYFSLTPIQKVGGRAIASIVSGAGENFVWSYRLHGSPVRICTIAGNPGFLRSTTRGHAARTDSRGGGAAIVLHDVNDFMEDSADGFAFEIVF